MAKTDSKKDELLEKPTRTRTVKPVEERAKKGRWITWILFFGTILFAYYFWNQY